MIKLEDIQIAANRISEHIHKTPVLKSKLINKYIGAELYFKCENFQKAGSFKIRGASNAVLSLNNEELKSGVVTHSSGNFAQALALAASWRSIPAYIVMPETAPQVKVDAVKEYGGIISFCKPTLAAREEMAKLIIKKYGAKFIHPYDNEKIIAGQGTATIEFLNSVSDLEIIMAPIGGGGLMGGTAIAARELKPDIIIIAAEPENANDAYKSFKHKKRFPANKPQTIADGLLTSVGDLNYEIMINYFDDIICCSEENIKHAMRIIWERLKIVIEPSAAVPLACIIQNKEQFRNKKTGIILSGGNIDLNKVWF
jgi:threonine dehydratase